jgi:hypothetical protein
MLHSVNGRTSEYELERTWKGAAVADKALPRKELSKTIKIFSRNVSPGRELNSGPPEYEEAVTATAHRSERDVQT